MDTCCGQQDFSQEEFGYFLQRKEINCIFHLSIPDVRLSRNYPAPALKIQTSLNNNISYHLGLMTLGKVNYSCIKQNSNPYFHCMKK